MSDIGNNYTFSDASIRNNADNKPVVILSQIDAEAEAIKILQEYFNDLEFSEIFGTNFGPINLSAEHPFALLLFQEYSGVSVDPSGMFPSVTVCDTSDSEDREVIGNTFREVELTRTDYLSLKNKYSQGLVQVSPSGMNRLDTHFQDTPSAVGFRTDIGSKSSIDFNIWSPNKLVTNFIYDSIKQCLKLYNDKFLNAGMKIHAGGVTGRKSGDYNMDFGVLLYGANLTVPMDIVLSAMYVDVKIGIINDIITDPDFHHTGEDL